MNRREPDDAFLVPSVVGVDNAPARLKHYRSRPTRLAVAA